MCGAITATLRRSGLSVQENEEEDKRGQRADEGNYLCNKAEGGGARGVCGGMCVCVCIPDTATLLGTLSTKSTVGWRHLIWSWGYERINYVVCV